MIQTEKRKRDVGNGETKPKGARETPTLDSAKRLKHAEKEDDIPSVLLIGEPKLRMMSVPVDDASDPQFMVEKKQLQIVLEEFRRAHGFGRAVSAPQIGVNKRFIALNLGADPFCMINPVITYRSDETFTMWDDCMSFPWLLVKVRRHKSISVVYTNDSGGKVEWNNIEQSVSELLQHEIDHLDGILAVDIALDKTSIIGREVYERDPEYFNQQVEYVIQPTIKND